ncbi:MAG: F0F1 ATP synthase subunit A [Firmicutes bacterium]|nr:F0F1 ATP synthase subunit A [Bacillota bacterium]
MNPILLAGADEISMEVEVLRHFNIFGIDFAFTNTLWYSLWIAFFLILFAFIVNRKLRHVDPMKPPKGLQNALEMAIGVLDKFTAETMGPSGKGFSAFYGCLFLYIMCCNLSGLFVWFVVKDHTVIFDFMRPPTADFAVTLGLGLITFFMTQIFGIRSKGVLGRMKALAEPVFLMTPINLIGEVANPVSLAFRLMGNILAGTIIMALYYGLLPMFAYLLTPVLHFYFDVFAGILQSFIFMFLSMLYVSGAME